MSGSISVAITCPSGTARASRTAKYPVPAPMSVTTIFGCSSSAASTRSGCCQASRAGLSKSLAQYSAFSNR